MPSQRQHRTRTGSVLPLLIIGIIALVAMIALAVDIGLIAAARAQAQAAADVAALAGARQLNGDTSSSTNLNNVATATTTATGQADNNTIYGKAVTSSMVTATPGIYTYSSTAQGFSATYPSTPGSNAWSVMQVKLNTTMPAYFGRIFGMNTFNVAATATAAHRPRDLALVLDVTGSMKFGTESSFYLDGSSSIIGSLNPDPNYPQFGHYYAISQRPLAASQTAPTSNGTGYNPMQRTILFQDSGGECHAANNLTTTAQGGPPVIQDFLSETSGGLVNAFYQPQADASYNPNQTPTAMPAPANFATQTSSPATYVGDKWPRVNGATSGTNWATSVADFRNLGTVSNSTAKNTTWEVNSSSGGYDGVTGYGPFKGYSMGPGYYGKTFWNWPPDPRWGGGTGTPDPTNPSTINPIMDTNGNYIADWRKRFFVYGESYTTTSLRGTAMDDNSILFASTGYMNQPSATGYRINYTALLKWLTTGPQVLPPDLRAGRLVYYSSIPTTIPTTGGTLVQSFWRDYINTVLGVNSTAAGGKTFYGKEPSGWGTVRITAKSSLTATTKPYMRYDDNPIRPRAHWWFGPLTMAMFLSTDNDGGSNMWPGTVHESHCWQLKAGMNSALDDIRLNHPNDWAAEIMFSDQAAFATPRVVLGRDYTTMKNALFYPFSVLSTLSDTTSTITPYTASGNGIAYSGAGDVPNANGGTTAELGFMVAYNQFSGATGYNGRRGAGKVVIFETDGVPNEYCGGSFQNNGPYASLYTGSIGTCTYVGNNASTVTTPAINVVKQICALDSASLPGYSTTRQPAYVHAIAFGDLFETTNTEETQALSFLLSVQQNGNTSASTDTSIESYKIITGDYTTRINNIQQAMQRIMQSGIQVSLIQ